jgi:hypothetical protein
MLRSSVPVSLCLFVFFVAIRLSHQSEGSHMRWENINQLCDVVRKTSFAIHCDHRNGHLEKVYENALANRLGKQGLRIEQQTR